MKRNGRRVALLGLGCALALGAWLYLGTRPTTPGRTVFVRFARARSLLSALEDLQSRGVVKNAAAAEVAAILTGHRRRVTEGTYRVEPGMALSTVLRALRSPMKQMVRIPETNWARRTANVLEQHDVCTAEDYMALFRDPKAFQSEVSFPIEGDTLEGYLFPDTYDLPPLLGAKDVVDRQLKAFEKKVWEPLRPKDLRRTLIIASMVELEVAHDSERPIVAGVIENRLARKMPLQIDATVLYARQKWGPLAIRELHTVKSPFNTYMHEGLPPGPICSPALKSIEAAMHPAKHDYLYYVAMPDGHHLFSTTVEQHEHNVRLRKAAILAESKKAGVVQ